MFMVHVSRFAVHGARFTIHGSRFVVRGSWFTFAEREREGGTPAQGREVGEES